MNVAEKLQHLRWLEGQLRGLGRPLTKTEVVRAMRAELGEGISHAYLCQLEGGSRDHLSPHTRNLLASFFKVHPGYLVGDPSDYSTGIVSDLAPAMGDLKAWLAAHAEEMRDDPLVYHVLLKLAREAEPRRFFLLLNNLLDAPPAALDRMEHETGGGQLTRPDTSAGAARPSGEQVKDTL